MAEAITQKKYITSESGFCEGHFPGHPIVPAAAQAQWMIDLAQAQCPGTVNWEIRQLKLLRELTPEREVKITLTPTKQGWRGQISDGDVVYAQLSLLPHD